MPWSAAEVQRFGGMYRLHLQDLQLADSLFLHSFLAILRAWRWRRRVPPKRQWTLLLFTFEPISSAHSMVASRSGPFICGKPSLFHGALSLVPWRVLRHASFNLGLLGLLGPQLFPFSLVWAPGGKWWCSDLQSKFLLVFDLVKFGFGSWSPGRRGTPEVMDLFYIYMLIGSLCEFCIYDFSWCVWPCVLQYIELSMVCHVADVLRVIQFDIHHYVRSKHYLLFTICLECFVPNWSEMLDAFGRGRGGTYDRVLWPRVVG
jgi:hypothetical protein